jgi:hypothetical protein
MKRLVLSLAIAALAVVAAETYKIKLYQDAVIGQAELQSGEYKLQVGDGKVVITSGKQSVESLVKVETADNKFPTTTVRFQSGDGKNRITEIRLGGTKTRLVFEN